MVLHRCILGGLTVTLLCVLAERGLAIAPSPSPIAIPSSVPTDGAQRLVAAIPQTGRWLSIRWVPKYAQPLNVWATYYYVHRATSIADGYPLLDPMGNRLGPMLSFRDWCYAALQGTVLVEANHPITYNFAGRADSPQVDCSPLFSKLSEETIEKVGRVRFAIATAPYGYGTAGFKLVPYRTIAVDPKQIPLGSVLYIPQARGRIVILPSGDRVVHDGYFFAADVGSAITGWHIDVFIGTSQRNPFPFVTSRENDRFTAFLIQDVEIFQTLYSLHR